MELLRTREKIIEAFEGIEETLHFVGPRQRFGVVPRRFTFGHGQRPVEEIADVREDLHGRAAILAGLIINVALGSIAEDFSSAIGDGGDGVAEQVAGADGVGRVHGGIR